MSRLTTNCGICQDKFLSCDIILSTFCGHIFHKSCLHIWKLGKSSCPICQCEFSSKTLENQLFLELDDGIENSQNNENIKASNTDVQSTKERMKLYFKRLQEQLTASERTTELEKEIKNLKQPMQQSKQELCIETKEDETKALVRLRNVEITEQNTNSSESEDDNIVTSNSALKNEIGILKQKVKHLTEELEKEIAISTSLYIKKFQKEGYPNIDTDNYLVIEGFPKNQLLYPLEYTVFLVGAKMHLDVTLEDIRKVRMFEDEEEDEEEKEDKKGDEEYVESGESEKDSKDEELTTDVVTLLVEFKSNHMKIKLLANKNILNNYLSKSYTLRTLGDDIHSLLVYANEKLKNCVGFTNIGCSVESCCIIAKHQGKIFEMFDREEVDELLQRYIQDQTLNAIIAKKGLKKHETNQN